MPLSVKVMITVVYSSLLVLLVGIAMEFGSSRSHGHVAYVASMMIAIGAAVGLLGAIGGVLYAVWML